MLSLGLEKRFVTMTGFGATWARFQPGTKESHAGRNRRVQARLRSPEKHNPVVCDTQPDTGAFK
jgi:hypothetical protein